MTLRVAIPRWPEVQPEWIHHYHDRLHEIGVETVDVSDADDGLQGCDGLLLTGGVDVDPSLYGEFPHMMTQAAVPGRDELEMTLLREAMARDLPVLAICRGVQLLNVCMGGSLLQHIDDQSHVADERNASSWHGVTVERGSRLYDVLGAERSIVNSRHHQAVTPDRLAPGLRITAMSDDGLVEAVEGTAQHWLVGVQWHPERLEEEAPTFVFDSKRLFEAYALALNDPLRAKRK
jgi:putative glutamine amidotransferase